MWKICPLDETALLDGASRLPVDVRWLTRLLDSRGHSKHEDRYPAVDNRVPMLVDRVVEL